MVELKDTYLLLPAGAKLFACDSTHNCDVVFEASLLHCVACVRKRMNCATLKSISAYVRCGCAEKSGPH